MGWALVPAHDKGRLFLTTIATSPRTFFNWAAMEAIETAQAKEQGECLLKQFEK